MRVNMISVLGLFIPLAVAFRCTPSAFQALLPANATVLLAQTVQNDSTFHVPTDDIAYPVSPTHLRALCAVQINVTSSNSSAYSFGLFLPQEWNERFLAVGNGGFSGGVNWLDMAAGVGYGFAAMSTSTGHNSLSNGSTWALNQPEKRIDFGYRAMHGSVVLAKHIVEKYYRCEPKYNYYSGCSTGGRQGLKEVEMFPEDFDGVLAGAPAWWTSHLQTWTLKVALYNLPNTSAHHIPPTLYPVIGAEVLKQCDPQDGLVDQVISDPVGCDFFPEALLCAPNVTNQTSARCLTAAQIGTLYHIYNDYVETNQTFVFPHLQLGSEAQWPVLLRPDAPHPLGSGYVRDFVLNDAEWNYYDFNYSIVQLADRLDPGNATAADFDLSPFQRKGGKLLHYHGLSDGLIPTGSSMYFYKQVLQTLKAQGIALDPWYRFFLVPGMQHCSGTPTNMNAPWYFAGATQAGAIGVDPGSVHGVPGFGDREHDALLALMAWTENGTAPDRIIATKWRNDTLTDVVERQRPLCPYPTQARYNGSGDPDRAESWSCKSLYDL